MVGSGTSCVFISHLLGEVLQYCDRIVVMRDGRVVAADAASSFDRDRLVTIMGGAQHAREPAADRTARSAAPIVVRARPVSVVQGEELVAHAGEVIGLAGLSGHGQTEMLLGIYRSSAGAHDRQVNVDGPVAFVAGDRQSDGIFPLWSIAENIAVRSLRQLRQGFLISAAREDELASEWRAKVDIRTPDIHGNILSLSGGNQQKALFARALASDARIILMDDPMRGVDIGTRLEMYRLIADQARSGRTFLWYTTETEELENCDHVYIFRNGRIVANLGRNELTEEKVIQSSFVEAHPP
jgi:ribose transport system ATP-binding protein